MEKGEDVSTVDFYMDMNDFGNRLGITSFSCNFKRKIFIDEVTKQAN